MSLGSAPDQCSSFRLQHMEWDPSRHLYAIWQANAKVEWMRSNVKYWYTYWHLLSFSVLWCVWLTCAKECFWRAFTERCFGESLWLVFDCLEWFLESVWFHGLVDLVSLSSEVAKLMGCEDLQKLINCFHGTLALGIQVSIFAVLYTMPDFLCFSNAFRIPWVTESAKCASNMSLAWGFLTYCKYGREAVEMIALVVAGQPIES